MREMKVGLALGCRSQSVKEAAAIPKFQRCRLLQRGNRKSRVAGARATKGSD